MTTHSRLIAKLFANAVALTLVLSANANAKMAKKINCSGTEPFWSLYIGPEGIHYKSPLNLGDRYYNAATPTGAEGIDSSDLGVYRTTEINTGQQATLIVREDSSCSDGMSERHYRYEIIYLTDAETLYGCCR